MYNDNLKAAGADEIEWVHVKKAGENMSCVLQSQVSRLFLYQRPFINLDDVIGKYLRFKFHQASYVTQLPDRGFHPKISYPKLKNVVISIFNGWLIRKRKNSRGYRNFFLKFGQKTCFFK